MGGSVGSGVQFSMELHCPLLFPTRVQTWQLSTSVVTVWTVVMEMVLVGFAVYAQLSAGEVIVFSDSENVDPSQIQCAWVMPCPGCCPRWVQSMKVVVVGGSEPPGAVQVPVSMTCPPRPPSPSMTWRSDGFCPPNHGVYSGTLGQATVVREVVVDPVDWHTSVSLHVVV